MSTTPSNPARTRKPNHISAQVAKAPVIKNWMTPVLFSVGKEQTLATAHRLMVEHACRHLPVLERGKLVGIVSQRDLYFIESARGVDLNTERVEEAMTQDVYWVGPDTPLAEVVSTMAEHKYGCTVIVDRAKVVGMYTVTDALKLLGAWLGRAGRTASLSE